MLTRPQHGGLLLVVALAAGLALAACGGSTSAPATSAPGATGGATVTIKDFAFTPQTLTVPVGAKVTWINSDSVTHTVTSAESMATDAATTDLFEIRLAGGGNTLTLTFDTAGTFHYLCTPHRTMASMHAEVVVK
jgi:plastocyanin